MSICRIERWKMFYAPNPALLRLRMEREGYRVSQWGDSPGSLFAQRKHNEEKSHFVISGVLEITVERFGTYTLEAGDRDFIAAHSWHSVRVISNVTAVYLIGEKIR